MHPAGLSMSGGKVTLDIPNDDPTGDRKTPSAKSRFNVLARRKKSMFSRNVERKTAAANGTAGNSGKAQYTVEEVEEYKQVFKLFDTDRSGSIGITNLGNAMHSLGLQTSKRELHELIQEVDADGNGSIDFDEFCAVMRRLTTKRSSFDEIIRQCFLVFDENKSGVVSEAEFEYVLRYIGNIDDMQFIDDIFTEADVDSNGVLDLDEFNTFARNYLTEEDLERLSNQTYTSSEDIML